MGDDRINRNKAIDMALTQIEKKVFDIGCPDLPRFIPTQRKKTQSFTPVSFNDGLTESHKNRERRRND